MTAGDGAATAATGGDGVNDNEQSHLLSNGHNTEHVLHLSARKHLHERVPFYARPKQLQRWGETQMLPHVNWGDLYFDLFYVAAAYQLSHAFKDEPTAEGLLYFVACYLSIFAIWYEKLFYDAKFVAEDDVFHRVMDVVFLCILGSLVVNIQPADLMKDSQHNLNMFYFATGLALSNAWMLHLYWDVKHRVEGGPEATWEGKLQYKRKFIGFAFHLAAAICAGRDYVVKTNDDPDYTNYWPAYLTISAYVADTLIYPVVLSFIIIPSMNKSHYEFNVPLNLEYVLHRIGEWVNLMLGESILSLLTLDYTDALHGSSMKYTVSFYAGLITVTLFQYLFFRTQPTRIQDHALRRSQSGAFLYIYSHLFYSASLILLGCSYKMILTSFFHRTGEEGTDEQEEDGVDGDELSPHRVTTLFCWSMTVSFVSLDFMTSSHRGLAVNLSRLRPNGRCAWIPSVCTLALMATWIFALCLISWGLPLEVLSVVGMGLVMVQVAIRTIGLRYFPVTKEAMERAIHGDFDGHDDQMENRRWPNVTEPRVE